MVGGKFGRLANSPVILNLFQDPLRVSDPTVQVEKWTLKQVQGDEAVPAA